jgi:hypothetical protein
MNERNKYRKATPESNCKYMANSMTDSVLQTTTKLHKIWNLRAFPHSSCSRILNKRGGGFLKFIRIYLKSVERKNLCI